MVASRIRKKCNVDRKGRDDDSINVFIKAVLMCHRRILRHAAERLGIQKSTLWDILKLGDIQPASVALKPLFTDSNKIKCL